MHPPANRNPFAFVAAGLVLLIVACSPIVVSKRPKTRGLPTRKLNTMIARASDKTARN